jgi:phage baseplate assembly protein W
MLDIKVLVIKDVLPIYKVEIAVGVRPMSLLITGDKLSQATEVLVNDVPAPEFIVTTPSRLVAQVPSGLRQSPITKVTVLAGQPSVSRSSLLYFEIGHSFQGLRGLERLVQLFCRILLQTPGSDRFYPNEGGGLLSLVGQSVSRGSASSLAAAVMHAVSQAKDQVVAKQARSLRIPADERLLTAEVTNTGFHPASALLAATISFTAMSGKQAVANMTF